VTALARRRAIRKVPDGEMPWAQAYAVLALIGGFAVAGLALPAALEHGPRGVDVPRAAMGERVLTGDRVLIAPDWMLRPAVGDIVVVDEFPGVDEALGGADGIAGVGRIIGVGGQVVGAIDGALYLCERLPDAAVGLQEEDGCVNASEIAYLRTPTPDFGPIEIPEGTYWVMSDDREAGLIDSRVYGAVPVDAIDGRVIAVVSPLSRLALL
jgi:signal peptidase I